MLPAICAHFHKIRWLNFFCLDRLLQFHLSCAIVAVYAQKLARKVKKEVTRSARRMFAVEGWKLPHIVAQKPEKKRKATSDATVPPKKAKLDAKKSTVQDIASTTRRTTKDKSKYLPYSKEKKGTTGPNLVPVAKERKPRQKSPTPPRSIDTASTKTKDHVKPTKKPLARPPRSEREKTPPKLLPQDPPPSFSGLTTNAHLTPLQQKMAAKLSGARFRWINEKLYTSTGNDALKLISEKPDMFDEYHAGFRSQVKDWPSNPIDIYHARLSSLLQSPLQRGQAPKVVADLGCGEAMLAQRVLKQDPSSKHVRMSSYDLKSANAFITACDIAHVPVPDSAVDIAIFCLSLMGTDFLKFVHEAYRILKPSGLLWISEIKSRFSDHDGKQFVQALKEIGFNLTSRDAGNKMFVSFDFVKGKEKKRGKRESVKVETAGEKVETNKVGKLLKPCTYKKR